MTRVMRMAAVAALASMGALIVRPAQEAGARSERGELTLIALASIREAGERLLPEFERKAGFSVKATWGSGGTARQQVMRGEPFDVVVLHPPYQDVIDSGNVVASSRKDLASVALGVAVRQGAPKPDISTPEAVKNMLLAARSITFGNAAGGSAAGASAEEMLKKLGIADQVQSKIRLPSRGTGGSMHQLATGEAEIGMAFLSEMQEPGIEVVGPVPPSVSTPTRLVGFVATHAKDPAAAKALLAFLASPEAEAAYKAHQMIPER
jgi:molybdate transport system substrate-binding protein